MAAAAANLACKAALPSLGEVHKPSLRTDSPQGSQPNVICKQCRLRFLSNQRSGSGGPRADFRALSRREGSSREGESSLSGSKTWEGVLGGRLQGRRSVRVRAEEPSDAEKQVQVKETLLRDALNERSKKGEEKQQEGFKVENRQQVTAIITGVISVLLAVGYLGLLSLDTRGLNLVPPPPEAYRD